MKGGSIMSERKHRTKEEIIAEIDLKIAHHTKCIKSLEEKKHNILNPKPRKKKLSQKMIVEAIKSSGMSIEEIAESLGIKIEE